MQKTLWQLTLIHFREFFREPGILFWSIIFPVLMAWVLGVAFSKPAEQQQRIALIKDPQDSNIILQQFLGSSESKMSDSGTYEYFKTFENEKLGRSVFRFIPTDSLQAVLMIKRGQVLLILQESKDSLHFSFDPRNSEAKLGYLLLSSALRNKEILSSSSEIKPLTSVGTRYIDFLLPGLIAMGLMNSIIWGISYGLIEMRVKKLLRRMVATPMKKWEFLVSHFIARFVLSIFEALILFGFGWLYFRVNIEGSLSALFIIFLSGNIAFAGLAMLMAARVENTRVGTGLINFLILPMTVLSGIFFSYHNFPDPVIPFIKVLPLTMLADTIRAVFIEGATLAKVLLPSSILLCLGGITFLIGLRIYKWY